MKKKSKNGIKTETSCNQTNDNGFFGIRAPLLNIVSPPPPLQYAHTKSNEKRIYE